MGLVQFFGFATSNDSSIGALPGIFDVAISKDTFIKNDITALFKKILTDVVQRTYGLSDDQNRAMWDNCLKSEANKGLISLLADAMFAQGDLFLVYKEKVLRKADDLERSQIESDYKTKGSSSVGIYISFKELTVCTMLKQYSEMEYSVLNSLNKKMNVSNAIQFKMAELRGSVGAVDKSQIEIQAKNICDALKCGKNVLMDGKDEIQMPSVEMESTKEAILFLDGKRSFFTGLPLAYINGQLTTGIGSTGQADAKAIDRGLQYYFISIVQPVCSALFNASVTFKSEDMTSIDSGLEVLKTFELVQGSTFLSADEQRSIVRRLFNLDSDASRKV